MAQEDEEEESSFLLLLTDEHADMLLHNTSSGFMYDDMWYFDIDASNHMTDKKSFYQSLDETYKGVVRFGVGSSIRYEGKGEVHVDCTNGERMILKSVHYIPKLDQQGCDIHLRNGFSHSP